MNTATTKSQLTELLDQVDSAAWRAALATDLDYPADATRELEEARRLLRLAADRVAAARRRVRAAAA